MPDLTREMFLKALDIIRKPPATIICGDCKAEGDWRNILLPEFSEVSMDRPRCLECFVKWEMERENHE